MKRRIPQLLLSLLTASLFVWSGCDQGQEPDLDQTTKKDSLAKSDSKADSDKSDPAKSVAAKTVAEKSASNRVVKKTVTKTADVVKTTPVKPTPKEPQPKPPAPKPAEFVAMDTSRLMALPYPFDLKNAFPKISFGNQRPLQVLFAPGDNDRLFVLCQNGKLHAIARSDEPTESTTFLDISDRVSRRGNEEGLLGAAFHPKYGENGELYIYYSAEDENRKPKSVISRFRVSADDANSVDATTEEVLLEIAQPFRTQNGGSIEFGPDGYLYIGLGDGGSSNDPQRHGQNLSTLLGSVLRIDVNKKSTDQPYVIPSDNPFVEQENARGEIWAYGFRNVWRLAFDRETGELWGGDVGQDRFEEVNLIVKGGNYGWSQREGAFPFDFNQPFVFPHSIRDKEADREKYIEPQSYYYRSDGRAVIGGRVYRGKKYADIVGKYIYADFYSGNIWALKRQEDGEVREQLICNARLQISGFGEDQDGELYVCAFDGNIYQLDENKEYWDGETRRFPFRLSDTGLFANTKELKPAAGLIPYSVNVPLWSDGVRKERYVALPEKEKVEFSDTDTWKFPVGTVVVKTFSIDLKEGDPTTRQNLETRLLVNGPRGWDGYAYHWNLEDDATLMEVATTIPYEIETPKGKVTKNWYFPSRSDCKACHTQVATFVLSLNTRQLNRAHAYSSGETNQLAYWNDLGAFSKPLDREAKALEAFPDWHADTGSVESRAKAYLDVNCAFCHAPGGPGNAPIDLRYHTPLDRMVVLGVPPRGTRFGGEPATAIVTPNRAGDSEIIRRMEIRGPGQMPTLATFLEDKKAVAVISEWINGMGGGK